MISSALLLAMQLSDEVVGIAPIQRTRVLYGPPVIEKGTSLDHEARSAARDGQQSALLSIDRDCAQSLQRAAGAANDAIKGFVERRLHARRIRQKGLWNRAPLEGQRLLTREAQTVEPYDQRPRREAEGHGFLGCHLCDAPLQEARARFQSPRAQILGKARELRERFDDALRHEGPGA